nr:ComF family protein [uncultured Pedobacter sp.]
MNFVNKRFQELIGLLFPNLCGGCGVSIYHGESFLCSKCLYTIPYTDYHLYPDNKVAKQFWGRVPLNAAMALMYFTKGGKVQNIIHNLKYKNQTGLGIKLGKLIGDRLNSAPDYMDIDLIIPVPLHKKRERSRGYNQSELIAQGISSALNVSVDSTLLIRTITTDTQTKKGRYMRFENMRTVFSVKNSEILVGKHILLVDDVITTGATIEACALELHKCGIKKLSIAAAAFAE